MGKIAIVGTSHKLNEYERASVRDIIDGEYFRVPKWECIITGDASGVDKIASIVMLHDKRPVIYKAYDKFWDGERGYKMRNMAIARECDELICITTQTKNKKCYHCNLDHERTGGCWTMQYAETLGKPTRLYVI